ncbi:phosphoserine phosphatase SerB [bacterium]|nr:phosphoserine phosphatase SerB [bacterium]
MSLPALDIKRTIDTQPVFTAILAADQGVESLVGGLAASLRDRGMGVSLRALQSGRCIKLVAMHERGAELTDIYEQIKQVARSGGAAYALFPGLDDPPEFRLAVMDMDSTLINQEVIEELAEFAGVREHVTRVTTLAMEGKLDFHQALRERVKLLKGQPASILDEVLESRITATPGLTELIAGFKKLGIRTAVVSGGFAAIVNRFAERVGLDHALANELEIVDGKLTGEVVGEIVDSEVKKRTLLELADRYRISPSQAIAIGDGANDLKMMSVSGLGIAFCAKPIVQEQALAAINRRRLDDALQFLA